MIISFAWTTPALLAGRKTVTRRDWKPSHAAHFRAGQLVDAWDKSPRAGGKHVAVIKITSITVEHVSTMPDSDYEAEGFAYLYESKRERYGFTEDDDHRATLVSQASPHAFERWRSLDETLYVVRFELVRVI